MIKSNLTRYEARLKPGDASTQEAREAKGSAAAWDMGGLRGAYGHIAERLTAAHFFMR